MKLSRFRAQALRAKDITSSAFSVDKQNTRYVAPAGMRETKQGWRITTLTKIPGQRSRPHVVSVQMPTSYEGTFRSCPTVKVDCDCSRYVFVWNYALAQHGGAIRDRTNGEPPIVTNPQQHHGICKHGLVALGALIKLNPRWPARVVTDSTSRSYGNPITLTDLHQALKQMRRR